MLICGSKIIMTMQENHISRPVSVFKSRIPPEEGYLAGYGALIDLYDLPVPLPDRLSLIIQKHKRYEKDEWALFSPRYQPEDTLAGHLTFALKYEGIELGTLKALFDRVLPDQIALLVEKEPTGQYSRRIWFLYEWLLDIKLDIPDLAISNFVDLVDEKLQFTGPVEISKRHRIRNNLPGVRGFCPLPDTSHTN
jgi:hypothetical protein